MVVVTADAAANTVADDNPAEVVTVTATNTNGGGASEGGVVIVTQTASVPTTDAAGQQSFVIETKTRRVRITYVAGTQTETADGALQTSGAKRDGWDKWAGAVGVGLGVVAGGGML